MNIEGIKMRAYRILRPLSRYKPLDVTPAPDYLCDLPNEGDDQLLGIYENVAGQRDGCVVFSIQGIYIDVEGNWTFIPYAQMITTALPSDDKHAAKIIDIQIAGGTNQPVVITGGEGRFRDVYEVSRFLDRVTAHK
jgi:hypothetical protein